MEDEDSDNSNSNQAQAEAYEEEEKVHHHQLKNQLIPLEEEKKHEEVKVENKKKSSDKEMDYYDECIEENVASIENDIRFRELLLNSNSHTFKHGYLKKSICPSN